MYEGEEVYYLERNLSMKRGLLSRKEPVYEGEEVYYLERNLSMKGKRFMI